jgi:hypothetical protein
MIYEVKTLPILDESKEDFLIDYFFRNSQIAEHPINQDLTNYRNLYIFPDKTAFFSNIFSGLKIDSYFFSFMSIQRITGKEFKPHIDAHRKLSLIYTIRGKALTSFYEMKESKLSLIHSYRMNLSKWYLFNNGMYHGVTDIQYDRISLIIDLTNRFKTFTEALDFFSENTNS